MGVFYICNDSEIDAERCCISMGKKLPIGVYALDSEGRMAHFSGIVQSVHFDFERPTGMRWRVVMDDSSELEPLFSAKQKGRAEDRP
jgi:hypothetical protein